MPKVFDTNVYSVGSPSTRPLAIVMIGGLVTSTIFTLLVLPAVYLLVEHIKGQIGGKRALGLRTQ